MLPKPESMQTNNRVFPPFSTIKDVFSSISVGIWREYTDASKNIWSNNIYTILSINKDSASCPSLFNLTKHIPLAHKPKLVNLLMSIKSGKSTRPENIEFKYKCQGAQMLTLYLTAEPVLDSEKKVVCWQGTIQNITNVLHPGHGIRSLAKSSANFLSDSPLLILTFDQDATLLNWNRPCADMTGYSVDDIAGVKEVCKVLFPEQDLRRRIEKLIQNKNFKLFEKEVETVSENGEPAQFKWIFYPFSGDGEKVHCAAVGQYVTAFSVSDKEVDDRVVRAEMLAKIAFNLIYLPEEENYFHHLGNSLESNIPDAYFMVSSVDSDQQFFTVEGTYGFHLDEWDSVLEILGWTPVGRRFQFPSGAFTQQGNVLIHEYNENLYDYSSGIISSVASRNLKRVLSIHNIYAVGLFYKSTLMGWVLMLGKSQLFENHLHLVQEVANIYSLAIYRKFQEQEASMYKIKADELSKQKSAYLANFGHEIRIPLNAILGFTQLLTLPNLPEHKRQQYIDIIKSKGQLLVKLINDMVDVSNVELGQLTVVNSHFDLNKLLRTLNDFFCNERVFQNREAVEVSLNIPDKDDPFMLYTDEGRLEQVLNNLLDNAFKFTEKGFIEFGYSVVDKNVEFMVKDSGIGIDESMHLAIFDRYEQVANQVVRTREGKGIGLAISKGIVELLGGTIWVESEPGKGATFKFSIPISSYKNQEVPSPEFDEERGVIPDWKNKVLLIAEDEEVNYLLVSEILVPSGVTMLWARDGHQAVDLVDSIKNIDAILMDIRMPIKNGYAASLEIRQLRPNVPIVAQTAYAYTEDREKAEAAGCNDFITKPIDSAELIRTLDKYLG